MVLLTEHDKYGEFVGYLAVNIESSELLYDVLSTRGPGEADSTKEYLEYRGFECTVLVGAVEVSPDSIDIDMPTEG